jgi:membrane fusion protein, epimerase transport system
MSNNLDIEVITNNIQIKPDVDDTKYKKIALTIIVVFIGLFVVWGGLAKLSSAVGAPGKVSVALNHKTIQHLEGGVVKEIKVNDGDHVNAGDILMVLENSRAKSELGSVESQYLEQLAMEGRLTAERDGKGKISFDEELNTKGNEALKQTLIKNQTFEFETRRNQLQQEFKVYDERKAQLKQQIDGLKSIVAAKESLLKSYKEEVQEWTALYKEQLIDKVRLRDVERERSRIEGDLASQKTDLIKLSVQISEISAQMMSRKGEMQKEVGSTLRDVQTKLSDFKARVVAMREALGRTELKAPVGGRVVGLSVHTIGGVVPSGKPIMDIVPDGEHLVMSCRVDPTNIIYVHKDLEAVVNFPSFSHIKSVKDIAGKVIDISADTLYDEGSRTSYYEAKIELTKKGEEELVKNHLQLIPGMPVDAMIITGERTFFEYLMQPIKNMFTHGMREQ